MILGIHHVSMKCESPEDFDRALSFYTGLLGCREVRSWPAGVMLDAGNTRIEIFRNGPGIRSKGAIRHLAFATDDVDEIAARVKAAGYDVFIGPKDTVIASDPPLPARMAFCTGPLGEEIEFFQEKPREEERM